MKGEQTKVLAILKVAPPHTGATAMNQTVVDAEQKWDGGEIDFKTISYASNIQDLGSLKIQKFIKFFRFFCSTLKGLIFRNYQLVYFQMSIYGASFYRDSTILLISKILGKKMLIHLHGKGMKSYGERHALYRIWISFLLRNQFAIVLTDSQKSDIDWIRFKEVFVVPNGTSIPTNFEKKWIPRSSRDPIKWIFLSNLLRAKGIEDVLKLAVQLKKEGLNFEGNIIGKEGDWDVAMIEEFIQENELERNLFYHGALYGDAKWQAIADADVLIFPTYNEAFGVVAIEAMGVGIPVIAYDEGGLKEIIIPGVNGDLVQKGDLKGLSQSVSFYQNNFGEMQRQGEEARTLFFSKFTSDIFITNLYEVFDRVIRIK